MLTFGENKPSPNPKPSNSSKPPANDSKLADMNKGTGETSIPKPIRPKESSVKPSVRKKTSTGKKQKEKRLSNAQLNKIVKDNFVKETSRTRTFTSDTMPGSKDFAKWFNELSIDEFELLGLLQN